jgi:aminoglycoside 2''-phosphotransferase
MKKEILYLESIKDAYPALHIHSARLHTSEGQFNDVLFVNDDLIFRFPRYADGLPDFLREIEILQKLQGHVRLPIPNPIYANSTATSVGRVFMGYQLLPGKPLFREVLNEIEDQLVLQSLAQQLAAFLHGLHTLSTASIHLDLPINDGLAESRTLYLDIRQHLFPSMRPDARETVTSHFQEYFNDPALHEYQPALIHGDFGGSNILFEGDKITGIIDFSFAGLDDPARDIAAVSTYGASLFTRICDYYPGIESLLERARFYRGTFALYEALHGFRNNDQEAFASGMEQYI